MRTSRHPVGIGCAVLVLVAAGCDRLEATEPSETTTSSVGTHIEDEGAVAGIDDGTVPVTPLPGYLAAERRIGAAPRATPATTTFLTSDGSIYCDLQGRGEQAPGCELTTGRIPDRTCRLQGGAGPHSIARIEFFEGPATPVCDRTSIVRAGATRIPDGRVVAPDGSPYHCLAEPRSVTCLDTRSKQGFRLTPARYELIGTDLGEDAGDIDPADLAEDDDHLER